MEEEKEKAIDKDQEIIIPAGDLNDDLSEADLEKTAGAGHCFNTGITIKCSGD